jgi:hypothetical protein
MASAPNLKMLNISDRSNSGGPRFRYSTTLSNSVHFTQLRELHLSLIKTSLNESKDFLRTSAPTLKLLEPEFVTLSDNCKQGLTTGGKTRPSSSAKEAWNFLRDDLSLQNLSMRGLAYQEIEVRVNDRLSRLSGRSRSDGLKPGTDVYNEKTSSTIF